MWGVTGGSEKLWDLETGTPVLRSTAPESRLGWLYSFAGREKQLRRGAGWLDAVDPQAFHGRALGTALLQIRALPASEAQLG